MSEFSIKDGTGRGYRAGVSRFNQLQIAGVATPEISFISDFEGQAFTLPMMNYPLSTPGTEYALGYFRNNDPARVFHIMRYFMSWNGGDTNHNRACDARLYVQKEQTLAAPTANHLAVNLGNLNLRSANVALAEAYLWTGAGNGMTFSSYGTKAQAAYLAQGVEQLDLDGSFIVGYNQAICITMTPEEAGKASLIVSGWFTPIVE